MGDLGKQNCSLYQEHEELIDSRKRLDRLQAEHFEQRQGTTLSQSQQNGEHLLAIGRAICPMGLQAAWSRARLESSGEYIH